MKALDLFCGLGGWSDGLALEGFDVLGVEIEPKIAKLYKHDVICADVRTLDGKDYKGYDLIVGSPPCRDFTQMPDKCVRVGKNPGAWAWKEPKNVQRGLTNVHAFLRIVEEAQPKYWLMENVKRLTEHLEVEPVYRARLGKGMYRYFWGSFPFFLTPLDMNKKIWSVGGKLRKWKRAKIPLPVAQALGRAVRNELMKSR